MELAAENPPREGEFRVFNQFTEDFSVGGLAQMVAEAAKQFGIEATVDNLPNPRVEKEEHYYKAAHTRLLDLGLQPHYLGSSLLDSLLNIAIANRDRIDSDLILPKVNWRPSSQVQGGSTGSNGKVGSATRSER